MTHTRLHSFFSLLLGGYDLCYMEGVVFLIIFVVLSGSVLLSSATTSTRVIIMMLTSILYALPVLLRYLFKSCKIFTISQFNKLWSSVQHTLQYGTWSDGVVGIVRHTTSVDGAGVCNEFQILPSEIDEWERALLLMWFEDRLVLAFVTRVTKYCGGWRFLSPYRRKVLR